MSIEKSKRLTPSQYAESNYPGQKTWQEIAKAAFRAGEENAIRVMRETEYPELINELKELRAFRQVIQDIVKGRDIVSLIDLP